MFPVGSVSMPPHFAYREVFLRGRPRHPEEDGFSLRHPPMEPGRRAKIFSPFDALRGFSDELRFAEAGLSLSPGLSDPDFDPFQED